MGKNKKANKQIKSLSMSDEVRELVKKEAKEQERSFSNMVEIILKEHFKQAKS